MYFRHLYATVQPTLEQRCDSWDNYCALFNVILSSNINMQVCFVPQRLLTQAVFMMCQSAVHLMHCLCLVRLTICMQCNTLAAATCIHPSLCIRLLRHGRLFNYSRAAV